MTGDNVIPFVKPKAAEPSTAEKRDEPHYYCLRCDGEHFKAYADGSVYCGRCGALMRNITMQERK